MVIEGASPPPHAGALLFACVSGSHTEAPAFVQSCPGVPLAGGFMCGEFGPVGPGGAPYVHAQSSSFAILRARAPRPLGAPPADAGGGGE